MKIHSAFLATGALLAAALLSASAQTTTGTVYNLNFEGQFTVADGQIHYWAGPSTGYQVYNISSGTTQSFGVPPGGVISNGYGDAFGIYDKSSGIFYAGTVGPTFADTYVYRYQNGGSSSGWISTGGSYLYSSLPNAYAATTHNGLLYYAGLPEGFNPSNPEVSQDTTIARINADGSWQSLIQVSGYSAPLAIDAAGNFYYATWDSLSTIYRWSAEQIASVNPDDPNTLLTLNDGEVLTDFVGGSNGVAVDAAGNVYFVSNNGPDGSYVGKVNADGSYDILLDEETLAALGLTGHLGNLTIDGDTIYLSAYGQGILGVQIPEPATVAALMGLGALALAASLRMRRRKAA